MSGNFAFSQFANIDTNGSIPRLWIGLCLREIRLLQTHNRVLTSVHQFIAATNSAGESRSALLAELPAMEQRSKNMLRDARASFQLARKYENAVSGTTGGDRVTSEMAAHFASSRASTISNGTDASQHSAPLHMIAAQPTPATQFDPAQTADMHTNPNDGSPSPLPPQMSSSHTTGQSTLCAKRRADDSRSDFDACTSSRKRRRVRGTTSGIGEKRASAEPHDVLHEDGYSNKRLRLSAPPTCDTPCTPPSLPRVTIRTVSKNKFISTNNKRRDRAEHYERSADVQRNSADSDDSHQAHINCIDVSNRYGVFFDSTPPQHEQTSPRPQRTSKRGMEIDEPDNQSQGVETKVSAKRVRRNGPMADANLVPIFQSIEEVEEEL